MEAVKDSRGYLDGFEVGAHGYSHEDFTLLDIETAEGLLKQTSDAIRDLLGTRPRSIRFPYMRTTPELLGLLPGLGFSVDSSLYSPAESCRPYPLPNGISELPVLRDPGSGRTSYLWPAHEGKRDYGSFISLAESVPDDGTFVLCDHSWHICESRTNGIRTEADIGKTVRGLRELLESLLELGCQPMAVSDAVSIH